MLLHCFIFCLDLSLPFTRGLYRELPAISGLDIVQPPTTVCNSSQTISSIHLPVKVTKSVHWLDQARTVPLTIEYTKRPGTIFTSEYDLVHAYVINVPEAHQSTSQHGCADTQILPFVPLHRSETTPVVVLHRSDTIATPTLSHTKPTPLPDVGLVCTRLVVGLAAGPLSPACCQNILWLEILHLNRIAQ